MLTAIGGAPQLAAEVRFDLGAGLAIAVRPMAIWYLPVAPREEHGGGVGAALGLHWYQRRGLSGPFLAIQAGDVEAFVGGGRGRMVGGSAIFGYTISYESGGMISMGLGLGYWHRMGVLDTGVQWPEILSLRLGAGWGFGGETP